MRPQVGVDSGDQTLGGSLLISCRPVYLTRKVKILYYPGFESRPQLLRIEIVIFDRIGRTEDFCLFQTRDKMKSL